MIYHYYGNGFLHANEQEVPRDYKTSFQYCAQHLIMGLEAGGPDHISAEEAYELVMDADIVFLLGETFMAGFVITEPWQYRDKFLCEEFFGPRFFGVGVDMQEFVSAASVLAKRLNCKWLEFGTRASLKPLALAKLASNCGARTSSVTLQREIQ